MTAGDKLGEITPVTFDGYGYPCFVDGPEQRRRWDALSDSRRRHYVDLHSRIQAEYGEQPPNLAVIESAFYGGA